MPSVTPDWVSRRLAAGVEDAGQAHVHELGPAVGGDDDVGRLDVAVDDAAAGGVGQPGGDLQHVVDRLGDRQARRGAR